MRCYDFFWALGQPRQCPKEVTGTAACISFNSRFKEVTGCSPCKAQVRAKACSVPEKEGGYSVDLESHCRRRDRAASDPPSTIPQPAEEEEEEGGFGRQQDMPTYTITQ